MKNPQLVVILAIAVVALVFSLKQTATVKKQQTELSALKLQQQTYETQFRKLNEEKTQFEGRFNETLNHLRQITQTKQELDAELENAKVLLNNLEQQKKTFSSSIQDLSKSVPVGFATLGGELKYQKKSLTKTTKEQPAIELKDLSTGLTDIPAKITFKGSTYTIENLPLGKYAITVTVKTPQKRKANVPEELKASLWVDVVQAGKKVVQDIVLE